MFPGGSSNCYAHLPVHMPMSTFHHASGFFSFFFFARVLCQCVSEGSHWKKISNIQVRLNLDFTCFLAGFLPKSKLGKNAIYPILVYKLDFVLTRT